MSSRPTAVPASAARSARLRGWLRRRVAGDATAEFWMLAATVAVLLVLGLVMTFSASFVQSTRDLGDPFGIFRRQLLWCVLGLVPMAAAALTDYRRLRRLAPLILAVSLVLAALVLLPGLGVRVQGARRWLDLGPLRFQPSELLKLALPLFIATILARRWPRLRAGDARALVMPALPVTALAAGLVLAGPDLETAALLVFIAGVVLYTAGLPTRVVFAGLGATLALGALAILVTPFRRARMLAWLDPMAHAGTFGYQSVQGFIALGSGGVLGRGLGQGRGQWLYVPNAHTDFIFAIIGEELGLVGALLVLTLFALLAVVGVRIARRAPDPFGRLLAIGITGWLLAQAAMNMGSVVGLLPVTGVTLPLVSFGGSSLVVTLTALGVLGSIARAARPARASAEGRK
jgi:cell division protein FtsW